MHWDFKREKATVSASPSALSADWDCVRQSLAVLCTSHEELAHFLASTFDQLETLSAELTERQRAFLAEREASRRELTRAQDELREQREALEASRAKLPLGGSVGESSDAALREQLQSLEQERTLLERELDSVRARAAELAESLSHQQRQMAEDRAQWGEELKSLRRLVERLVLQTPERETVSVAGTATLTPAVPNAPAEAAGSGVDPVLDSVMAQFTMLQKDLTQRRKAAASAE